MDSPLYDVVILGGGPAGMATSLSLLQHNAALRVAVIERSGYDQPRIGETLHPTAQPLLKQLGVWGRFDQSAHLTAYGTSAAWGSDMMQPNDFLYSMHGAGWHLERCTFDAMLADAAAKRGAEVCKHTQVLDCQETNQGWQLTIQTGKDAPRQWNARFVVDATGRLAWFARQRKIKPVAYDQLTGVAVLLEADSSAPLDTFALVEACELGWWYSALLPANRLMVMFLSDADIIRQQRLKTPVAWLEHARLTHYTQGRLRHARPLGKPTTHAAHTQCLPSAIGDKWLAVGDAASTFDPLSSQGISKGLRSGIFASYAILQWLQGQPEGMTKYAALHQQEFEQYRIMWAKYYAMEQRWPNAPFWQRRTKLG